jgi:hypothetical protein
MSATPSAVPSAEVAVQVPVKIALASDSLFSSKSCHSDLAEADAVCIDLDERITAEGDVSGAAKWLSAAKEHNKRVLVIGSSQTLRSANSLRRTGAFFLDRKSLAPKMREARGHRLVEAITEFFVQSYSALEKTPEGYVHTASRVHSNVRTSPPPAPPDRPERVYTKKIMTREQKNQFRDFMHRP